MNCQFVIRFLPKSGLLPRSVAVSGILCWYLCLWYESAIKKENGPGLKKVTTYHTSRSQYCHSCMILSFMLSDLVHCSWAPIIIPWTTELAFLALSHLKIWYIFGIRIVLICNETNKQKKQIIAANIRHKLIQEVWNCQWSWCTKVSEMQVPSILLSHHACLLISRSPCCSELLLSL